MSTMAESLVVLAEQDLKAAGTLLSLSTRTAAASTYHAAAKLLEALVRVDTNAAAVPRGQIERLVRRLSPESPFATQLWRQIEPTWAAEAYDLLIAADGTIAPDPPESRVRQALRDLRMILPSIRNYVRTAAAAPSAAITAHPDSQPNERAQTPGSAQCLEQSVTDKQGRISPEALAELLDLGIIELVRMFRLPSDALRDGSASETQLRLAEVLNALTKTAALLPGDIGAAVRWLKSEPIASFDHATAAQLIAAGHVDAVMNHLDCVENGIYA